MSSLTLLLGFLVFVNISSGAPSTRNQIRIVGGTESPQGKWPFFAGIFFSGPNSVDEPYCGGVVWDKDTVLTAAHCVPLSESTGEPNQVEVYLGHNKWSQKDANYLFKSKEIFIHPSYKREGQYDGLAELAVIRLERSIDFDGINSKVECVCDPEPLELLDTSKCVTMGWGRDPDNNKPSTIIEVILPMMDNPICAQFNPQYFVPDSLVCAGYDNANICSGDSGGPLVCPQVSDPSKYSLVGITAFSMEEKICPIKPSYFTKVETYLEWIALKTAPSWD